jgi:hypothetical protein
MECMEFRQGFTSAWTRRAIYQIATTKAKDPRRLGCGATGIEPSGVSE